MIKRIARLITPVALAMALAATAGSFDFSTLEKAVTQHKLKNGLTLLVFERHDAPVVSFTSWANVGSVDDPKGYTGLAHMFEHMAFKGTTTLGTKDIRKETQLIKVEDSIFMELRSERNKGRLTDTARVASLEKSYEAAREASYQMVIPNEFGNIVEREGGQGLNAGTWNDQTVYFFDLPSNKVELWMALESERFLNPVLREMYKERDVVAEERRMSYESSPFGRLYEQFIALAFQFHPYGASGIGVMSDIQNYSRKEAKAFFEKYYVPANMVIVVAGDVNPAEVIKLADKYWGRIPYRPAPELIATVEPPQEGERRTVIEDPSQPLYMVGWHTPELTHPDYPAVDALVQYLASGRTSRLYTTMVKEAKIASRVQPLIGEPGDKYPNLAGFFVVPSANHSCSESEGVVFSEIEKVQQALIPVEQLNKIKARAKASFIGQLDSNNEVGFQLAMYQMRWGDWHEMLKQLDRINALTPEDIQRVAIKYFTTKNRVVAMINTAKS